MGHNSSRVRVIDRSQRVLLSSGDIQTATGLMLEDEPRSGPWVWVKEKVLRGLYDRLLRQPTDSFVDDLYAEGTLEGDNVISALTGAPRAVHGRADPQVPPGASGRLRHLHGDGRRLLRLDGAHHQGVDGRPRGVAAPRPLRRT